MRAALLGLLACTLGCGGVATRTTSAPVSTFSYDVHATGGSRALLLDVCFPGDPPVSLVAPSRGAASRLRGARGPTGGALAIDALGRVSLAGLAHGSCATLDVDVHPGDDEPGWPRSAMVIAEDAQMLPTPAWLWRPDAIAVAPRVSMRVASHGDESLAVPFPCTRRADGALGCTLDRTAFAWDGQAAIGRLERRAFAVGGGVIDVVRARSATEPSWDVIEAWMVSAGGAASAILGRLPAAHILVILATTDWGSGDPVYFGYTTRGGGASILFVLRADATSDELVPEWVAVHEMAHLALPVVPDAESWLSEGFATYEQEVLRARAGTRSVAQALYAIAEGCSRGDALSAGEPLGATSVAVHRTHRYARVYWGGAAAMLELDLQLHAAGRSLDERMRHVAEGAAGDPIGWNAGRVLDALDEGLPRPLAHEIAARHLAASRCLLDESFRALGATIAPDGSVTVADEPSAAARRAALFGL